MLHILIGNKSLLHFYVLNSFTCFEHKWYLRCGSKWYLLFLFIKFCFISSPGIAAGRWQGCHQPNSQLCLHLQPSHPWRPTFLSISVITRSSFFCHPSVTVFFSVTTRLIVMANPTRLGISLWRKEKFFFLSKKFFFLSVNTSTDKLIVSPLKQSSAISTILCSDQACEAFPPWCRKASASFFFISRKAVRLIVISEAGLFAHEKINQFKKPIFQIYL